MLRAFEWDQDGYVDDLWEPSDNHLQDVSLGSSPGPRESVTVIAAVEDTDDPVKLEEDLIRKTDALNEADDELEHTLDRELRSFENHPEQYEMQKAFDYENRLMVDTETGEVTMKMYYMHPASSAERCLQLLRLLLQRSTVGRA